ncbi:hypothetical protein ACFL3F_05120 [Planctomycetota bacterium]
MFALSLGVFVFVLVVLWGVSLCLDCKLKGIEGNLQALNTELTTISTAIAVDMNEVRALEAEEIALAKSEQMFTEGDDQATIWRADARWSEMGKSRVREIWNRRQMLQVRLTDLRTIHREKTSELMQLQAKEQQKTYLRDAIKNRRYQLYGILLLGGFGILLFAILWHALVQKRVNRILQNMAR